MTGDLAPRVRSRIRVEGTVQGVGFRPFVYALATEHRLVGLVGNDPAGVFIEAEGAPEAVQALVDALQHRPPALACVDRVTVDPLPLTGEPHFQIVSSVADGARQVQVAPDTATCDDCLAELFDPADRRFRHPFINCTNCGPRFTIITDLPYDRGSTTMAGFPMCPACAAEYADPADRRFHAQPVCCPDCGPTLQLVTADGEPVPGDPVHTAADWLRRGAVLAVKGIGGYHLAVDASSEPAVAALRARKNRPHQAFAVLVPDLAEARRLGEVPPAAAAALAGRERPIVLLPRRPGSGVAAAVAPGTRELGLLLPYTPLHHLLARAVARPLVFTSGNLADDPISYRDTEARTRLAGIAAAYLTHDRPIHTRVDDSVVRVERDRARPVRRSRGYAPRPLTVPQPFPRPVLACGADQKNTVCLGQDEWALLSQHLGDIAGLAGRQAYAAEVAGLCRLFRVTPAVVACDLHPDYATTRFAHDYADRHRLPLRQVQHHHAHIAACLADNGEAGPVVGVAFDGTGYGPDGTVWGGELLVADLASYRRVGHLRPVPMPGGAAAVREPWRMAAAYLQAAGLADPPGLPVARRHSDLWSTVAQMAARGINAPLTSSAGRLFDAVAALAGLRDRTSYQGQAAVELEQCADPAVRDGYPVRATGTDPVLIEGPELVAAVLADLRGGTEPTVVAARFHNGLAGGVGAAVTRIAEQTGLDTVALSGGVFANQLLLAAVRERLEPAGLRVLVHHRVPPNDGGISLGQAVVAAALDPPALDPPALDPPALDPPALDPPALDPPSFTEGGQ